MQDKEQKLIENLFDRLKKTEMQASTRDQEADILIQKLVKIQPASSYYMIQTILIQEAAIKKMNAQIEELKEKLLKLESQNNLKESSFLSNFFSKKTSTQNVSPKNNLWNNNTTPDSRVSPVNNTMPVAPVNNNSSGSFLKNALQTATGVAGGMVLGNMLNNLFHHSQPEEEIFNTIDTSVSDSSDHNFFHDSYDGSLMNNSSHSYDESIPEENLSDEYFSENSLEDTNSFEDNDIDDNLI